MPLLDERGLRISYWHHKKHMIHDGVLMRYHFDIETAGKNGPMVEFGDALGDIHGNYLDSLAMPIRLMAHHYPELAAASVQQVPGGVGDFYGPHRKAFREAMAWVMWRFEHSPLQLDRLGTEPRKIDITDVSNVGGHEKRKRIEGRIVVPQYFLGRDGRLIEGQQFHLGEDGGFVGHLFSDDPNDNKKIEDGIYQNFENGFYIDESTGLLYKKKIPTMEVSAWNGKNFDFKRVRIDLASAGVHPQNIDVHHSRVTFTDVQRPRPYISDGRDLLNLILRYGRQDDERILESSLIHPETGRPYVAGKLSQIAEVNTRDENLSRGIGRALEMADSGGNYDPNEAHGAGADAIADFSFRNLMIDTDPDIEAAYTGQMNRDRLRAYLTERDEAMKKPQIYALGISDFPYTQKDAPYQYIGTDAQLGARGNFLFVRLDIDLEEEKIIGEKTLGEMEVEDFLNLFQQIEDGTMRRDECIVRYEKIRDARGIFSIYDDVILKGRRGKHYVALQNTMDDARAYLKEHQDIIPKIRAAFATWQRTRNSKPAPQYQIMEQSWPFQGFGETLYPDPIDEEIARLKSIQHIHAEQGAKGPGEMLSVLETLKNRRDDVYARYLNIMGPEFFKLILTTHLSEYTENKDTLERMNTLVKKVHQKFKDKNIAYAKILKRELGGAVELETHDEVREFREKMQLRVLNDYATAYQKIPGVKEGYWSKEIMLQAMDMGLWLIPTPVDGLMDGAHPHEVDEWGNELRAHDITKMDVRDVYGKLETGKIAHRFHGDQTNPAIWIAVTALVEEHKFDLLPEAWQEFYLGMRQLYWDGPPDVMPDHHTWPTRPKFKQDMQRVMNKALSSEEGPSDRAIQNIHLSDGNVLAQGSAGQAAIVASGKFHAEHMAAHPHRPELRPIYGHDPRTGMKLDACPYVIKRDFSKAVDGDSNFVTVDIPAEQTLHPFYNSDHPKFPSRMMIMPRQPARVMRKIKDVLKGRSPDKPIVIRNELGQLITPGRLFTPGKRPIVLGTLEELRKKSKTRALLSEFTDHAESAWERAGLEFPQDKNAFILAIEEHQYFVVGSQGSLPYIRQSVRLPDIQFYATVNEKLAGFSSTVRAQIAPASYFKQEIKLGEALRIYQTNGDPYGEMSHNGRNTGQTYQSILTGQIGFDENGKAEGISLNKLLKMFEGSEIGDEWLEALPHTGLTGLDQQLSSWANKRFRQVVGEEKFVLIRWEQVLPESWAITDPDRIFAAFSPNGVFVPPSYYKESAQFIPETEVA